MAEHRFFLEEQFYLGKCNDFATTILLLLLSLCYCASNSEIMF